MSRTITLPASASLAGTATDDGQPGALTTTWSQVSGPGTVTFGDVNAVSTSASFSAAGVYVLRLRASDGALASTDDVTVTVRPAPTGIGARFGAAGARVLRLHAGNGALALTDDLTVTVQPAPTEGNGGNGLTGSYYNGINFDTLVFIRTDPTVDFTWGQASPGPGVQADGFSVRWSGQVQAPVTGTYTFSTVPSDGVRLFVNGQLIINNWTVHGTTTNTSAGIALQAGVRYPITMEYFENAGSGVSRLLWTHPGQTQTVIPPSRLFP